MTNEAVLDSVAYIATKLERPPLKVNLRPSRLFTLVVGTEKDHAGGTISAFFRDTNRSQAVTYLAENFGGFTAIPSYGGWKADNGEVVTEDSLTIQLIGDHSIESIRALAAWLRDLYQQSCVLVTVTDTTMAYI